MSYDAIQSYLCFCLGFAIDLLFYGHFRDVVSIAHSCEPLLLCVFAYALRNRFGARYLCILNTGNIMLLDCVGRPVAATLFVPLRESIWMYILKIGIYKDNLYFQHHYRNYV